MSHVLVDQVKSIKNVVEVYKKTKNETNTIITIELRITNFLDLNTSFS